MKEKIPEQYVSIIKCVVAGFNDATGEPDLYFVQIQCNDQQYSEGLHYEHARNQAEASGYNCPLVVFDENDEAGRTMLPLFDWDTATTVTI